MTLSLTDFPWYIPPWALLIEFILLSLPRQLESCSNCHTFMTDTTNKFDFLYKKIPKSLLRNLTVFIVIDPHSIQTLYTDNV